MPPIRAVSNTDLGIRLLGDQTEYAPGDTIVGYVSRSKHLVAQISSLSIQLVGRTVSKTPINCENGSRYHGRFNLIPRPAKQKLHQGPLHVTDGYETSWRFAIKIPEYVDPEDFKGGNPGESYLSLDVTNNPLPSTFTLGGERSEAFVEYFIGACLRTMNEDGVNKWIAKFPVTVTNHRPFLGSRLHRQIYFYSMTSPHLLGMGETKPSLSQTVKQAMGISGVPRLEFNLQVEMPSVIQLNDPSPIPIRLRAIMNRDLTSKNIRNKPLKIKLSWISIQIIATTEILCQGAHTTEEESEANLDITSRIPTQEQEIYIPCTEHGSFIDVGELVDLRLDRYYNRCHEHQGLTLFTPTFVTYNIRLSHRLSWTVVFEVAGQAFKIADTIMLTILGPSDQGMDESSVSWSQSEADIRHSWDSEEDFVTWRTPKID
ncbi:hypothetical protein BHE90_012503 [Fusarium euwallaceae]|uniref:Arrestin-like N-terminal domain-containing protein n=2 Tax=Fusarium solani species complex TaxID=232080 RepID=A0A3M2RSW0_9HYPO|nr:hypothetical protein CDV36_012461 [Fusarium kuroshium]RTE73078.1 hypothetical protein BHE90_012503 [Fusarium euwallaceae]